MGKRLDDLEKHANDFEIMYFYYARMDIYYIMSSRGPSP